MRLGQLTALTILLSLAATFAAASPYPRIRDYQLDVTFDPSTSSIEASARVHADFDAPPTSAIFYLHHELNVDSVKDNRGPIPVTQEQVQYGSNYSGLANKVTLGVTPLPEGQAFYIYYSGHMRPSSARSPSDYMRIDSSGVYLRSYGYSLWFPVFLEAGQNDYPVDFGTVVLRTPPEMRSIFVGSLADDQIIDNQRVSVWNAPNIRLFDAQCTARNFDVLYADGLHIYHHPDAVSAAAAKGILACATQLIDYYTTNYGPAGNHFDNYIVQMPKYGDISSGNVTGIQDDAWTSFENNWAPKYTLAHELAHPFVQVEVDCNDPIYALAVEGLPSFFHLPALEDVLGFDWYQKRMTQVEDAYMKRQETGLDNRGNSLPPEKPIDQLTPDDIGEYKDCFVLNDRAVLFLNYLRTKMGHETFARCVRELLDGDMLTMALFVNKMKQCFPDDKEDIDVWLSTTQYPSKFYMGVF
ncbi:MAG: hypothetical protein ABIE70_10565 [bacterium]